MFANAFDHVVLGFLPAVSLPPSPRLIPQLFVSPPFPTLGSNPPSAAERDFEGSLDQEVLCTLQLVRVLAEVRGEFKLTRVASDARCELKPLVEVGEGGARSASWGGGDDDGP